MKELDEGSGTQTKHSDDDAVLVDTNTISRPSTAGSIISTASSKKKGKGRK